jgi:hypothetical protein
MRSIERRRPPKIGAPSRCSRRARGQFAILGEHRCEYGGTLENAQLMAAHESPRITKLYDRRGDEITLDEVERIAI